MSRDFDPAWFMDEDDEKPRLKRDKQGFLRREGLRYEFDCPECDANNPWPDGFDDQDEITCHYCGQDFRVTFLENKKIKFKLI